MSPSRAAEGSRDEVLITCPQMLSILPTLRPVLEELPWILHTPEVLQTLTVDELVRLVPEVDGWIVGDDPATRQVLSAGAGGRLRALVKWGAGVDNVDFEAARELGLEVRNTPGLFGEEVADVAIGYAVALARHLFAIDRGVRRGEWPKPQGISLAGRRAAVVGFGTVGRALCRRLLAAGMRVLAYDPQFSPVAGLEPVEPLGWPERIETVDFLFLCCPLSSATHHLVNAQLLSRVRPGLRLVNVARGAVVDERALPAALDNGLLAAAALDVFEQEPLSRRSPLWGREDVLFGSHNASNTAEAAERASLRSIEILGDLLAATS